MNISRVIARKMPGLIAWIQTLAKILIFFKYSLFQSEMLC